MYTDMLYTDIMTLVVHSDNRIFKLDLERQFEIMDCTLETLGAIRLSGPVGMKTV